MSKMLGEEIKIVPLEESQITAGAAMPRASLMITTILRKYLLDSLSKVYSAAVRFLALTSQHEIYLVAKTLPSGAV
jgi:hypothetical protein